MTHLLHKELRLWHIKTTLSVSTKQKQQSNQQMEKRATIREAKTNRLSESMISVNDDCQGGELKQGKLRKNERNISEYLWNEMRYDKKENTILLHF